MRNSTEILKLEELRAKTDRQLLRLMHRELERATTLANLASGKGSALDLRAEEIYAEVNRLLPGIARLSREQREKVENRLKELRRQLDGLPAAKTRHAAAVVCSLTDL
jgi:hypothetical protein